MSLTEHHSSVCRFKLLASSQLPSFPELFSIDWKLDSFYSTAVLQSSGFTSTDNHFTTVDYQCGWAEPVELTINPCQSIPVWSMMAWVCLLLQRNNEPFCKYHNMDLKIHNPQRPSPSTVPKETTLSAKKQNTDVELRLNHLDWPLNSPCLTFSHVLQRDRQERANLGFKMPTKTVWGSAYTFSKNQDFY